MGRCVYQPVSIGTSIYQPPYANLAECLESNSNLKATGKFSLLGGNSYYHHSSPSSVPSLPFYHYHHCFLKKERKERKRKKIRKTKKNKNKKEKEPERKKIAIIIISYHIISYHIISLLLNNISIFVTFTISIFITVVCCFCSISLVLLVSNSPLSQGTSTINHGPIASLISSKRNKIACFSFLFATLVCAPFPLFPFLHSNISHRTLHFFL